MPLSVSGFCWGGFGVMNDNKCMKRYMENCAKRWEGL
jgi:hypothetical protein